MTSSATQRAGWGHEDGRTDVERVEFGWELQGRRKKKEENGSQKCQWMSEERRGDYCSSEELGEDVVHGHDDGE